MTKKKNYTNNEKIQLNNRHIKLYNKSLDGLEILLDSIIYELKSYDGTIAELPKTVIAALDFVISSLTKLQKGQRLALGLDNETHVQETEPQISVIEGVDIKKI